MHTIKLLAQNHQTEAHARCTQHQIINIKSVVYPWGGRRGYGVGGVVERLQVLSLSLFPCHAMHAPVAQYPRRSLIFFCQGVTAYPAASFTALPASVTGGSSMKSGTSSCIKLGKPPAPSSSRSSSTSAPRASSSASSSASSTSSGMS